jgi:hypothetical protein
MAEHAISPEEIGPGRYVRYERGDDLSRYYGGFPDERKLQQHARLVAGQCGGFLIARCGIGPSSPPQLRPDEPVYTSNERTLSYHPSRPDAKPIWHKTKKGKTVRVRPLPAGVRERHLAKSHSDGQRPEGLHTHRRTAKYVLPPGPHGKRLDVPFLGGILDAEIVYFVIEGSPKTDAILSTGEAAFGVPSVTLWDAGTKTDDRGRVVGPFAPELNAFIELTHLRDKRLVVIVPDADWVSNPMVITQAMLAREHLRSRGVRAVVAAPPLLAGAVIVDPVHGPLKGVDDWLRAGGSLDELTVLVREVQPVPAALALLPHARRKDAWMRSARALVLLPLLADGNGELIKSISSFARILRCSRDAARKAVADLAQAEAIEVEGSLDAYYQYHDHLTDTWHDYDWDERPRIRFKDEFQARDIMLPLGEYGARPELGGKLEREVDPLVRQG